MSTNEQVERVRIYLNEQERHEGQLLYLQILEHLRRAGATGATVLRGLAGFGPGSFVRLGNLNSFAERPPAVIEWVDRADRIPRILEQIDELLGSHLVTIETVRIHRAVLRRGGVLAAGESAGDLARSDVQTLTGDATLGEAITILLTSRQGVVPVVDAQQRAIGILAERELALRAGIRLPIRLLRILTPEEQQTIIAPVANRRLADVMSDELRGISANLALIQVLILMQERGYDTLPILGGSGEIVGLLGQDEVLSAMIKEQRTTNANVRDADPPTPIGLIMQGAGARISITTTQGDMMERLLPSPAQTLVVEQDGRVMGLINSESIIAGLSGSARSEFIEALQRGSTVISTDLVRSGDSITSLIQRDLPRLLPTNTMIEAAQRLIETGCERLPIVDTDQRIQGMITRGGIMRALTQEQA